MGLTRYDVSLTSALNTAVNIAVSGAVAVCANEGLYHAVHATSTILRQSELQATVAGARADLLATTVVTSETMSWRFTKNSASR